MGFSVQDVYGVTSLGKQETKKYVDIKKGDIGADIRRLTKKRNLLNPLRNSVGNIRGIS